jgi:predicted dehydrogenase
MDHALITPTPTGAAESEASVTRVAVWGTGSIGSRHVRVLAGLPHVQPIAVSIRDDRRQELARDGVATAAGLDEALAHGARAVIVATDTGRHAADAIAAIDHGLDVLVEKPMAADAVQARRMADHATARGRVLAVGCVMRFCRPLQTLREQLPAIGRVHRVLIACHSYLPEWRPQRDYRDGYAARAADGGVLRDLVHEIDYAAWLFGWPTAVQASVRNLGRLQIASDEAADLWWTTADGLGVSISLDYLSHPSRRRVTVLGEHGTLEWDGIRGAVTVAIRGRGESVIEDDQSRDQTFAAQAAAFLAATQGGGWDPRLATAADGVRALSVCDAARLASTRRADAAVEPA